MSALDVSLQAIAERLRTQDNHCTREPLYLVQQRHRITGLDPRFSDDIAWWDGSNCCEATPEEHARLEAAYEESGDEPDGWTRSAFQETWEFVTCCLTEAAAKAFIEANAHRLKQPRVYVDSAYRNDELIAVRKILAERAP